ncbi:MAG: hypothetical protein ABIZ91_02310 [Gemmatimonadaceae bacterium]
MFAKLALVGTLLAGIAIAGGYPAPAMAQAPGPVQGTTGSVLLQLRPRPGDLLRLRLDQTIEMGGGAQGGEDADSTEVTSLVMLARLSVESADAAGATILAFTDSVRVKSDQGYRSPLLASARALEGLRFRFRVAPDGSTTLASGDAWVAPAVGSLLSQLPATLPAEPVSPGSTWNRAVEIPLAATPDGKATATLTATFRFDSLSRTGEFAYLSMRGRLVRSGPMPASAGEGGRSQGFVQTSGSVTGNMLIDRRRGWITDARTVIDLRSLVSPAGKDSAPIRVRMKITQWMRVM